MMLGGGTKPSAYCKLSTYVQHNAPLLYDNIQDLCMFGILNTRGDRGVTLLLPEKKTQKEIDNMVGRDASKAVEMIQSLVLPVYLRSLSEFSEDIPNRAGTCLPVKKVSSSSVELDNGAVISVDGAFQRLYTNANIACYKLSGGVPVSNKKSSEKKGGFYTGGSDTDFASYGAIPDISGDWKAHVETLKAQMSTYIKNDSYRGKSIDPMTLTLISLSESSEHKYDSKLPGGPLAALFLGEQIISRNKEKWAANKEYQNKESLYRINSVFNDSKKKLAGKWPVDTNTLSINNIAGVMCGMCKDTGSDSEFWLSAQEFCYYFTVPFIDAIQTRQVGQVNRILDHYINHVYSKIGKDRFFFLKDQTETPFEHFQKERYCTLLSFYVNDAFLSSGIDMNAAGIEDGTKSDGIIYGWGASVRPDNISTRTSYHNRVAGFWSRTVRN